MYGTGVGGGGGEVSGRGREKQSLNYGDALYWDLRYMEEGGAAFDWYQRYSALRPFVRKFVPTPARVLMVGCGSARTPPFPFPFPFPFPSSPFPFPTAPVIIIIVIITAFSFSISQVKLRIWFEGLDCLRSKLICSFSMDRSS